MMDFFPLSFYPLALNISDSTIKMAQIRGNKLVSFGFSILPEKIVEGGEIKDKEKLVFFIRKTLVSSIGQKIKNKFVALCLPEDKVVTHFLSFPLMTNEELKSAIPFELEHHLPLPISDFYFDWERIETSSLSQKIEVITFSVSKKIVQDYLEVMKIAEFSPVLAQPESLATLNLFKEEKIKENNFLILDIGASKTTFIFVANFKICFSFTSPLGSKIFTQNISKSLNISFEEAEKLKRKVGLKKILKVGNNQNNLEEKVYEALIPSLVDLAQQTKKFLAFYNDWAKKRNFPPIKKVFLVGGGANLLGLLEFLEKQLEIKIEKFKIKNSLLIPSSFPMTEEMKISFLPVFGLAKIKI